MNDFIMPYTITFWLNIILWIVIVLSLYSLWVSNRLNRRMKKVCGQVEKEMELLKSPGILIYDCGNGHWATDLENITPGYKPTKRGILMRVEDLK